MEQGFNEEVDELESKMSTMEGIKTELQEQLHKKADEDNQVLQRDLDKVQVKNRELHTWSCGRGQDSRCHHGIGN